MCCNFDGERVGMIYGHTLCGGESVEEAAENSLSRYIGLFGMARTELVRTRVIDPPESGGPAYVRYEQVCNGVPVEGASLTLVVSGQSGHAVKRVPNRCHPSPASFLRADIKTAEEARQIVDSACDGEPDFHGEAVVVAESAKSTALSTNLDTSPGWTVGTNEWTHGLPGFTQMGEQPGFDYPYDVLGVSPQHKCYYTGANGSVTGTWDLETTAFDLTDADGGMVSYAVWFYARSATYQTHKFEVAIKDSNGSWTTVQTIDVPGGVARVRWIRQRAKLPNVPFGSGMKLRFRAIGDTTPKIEACVDEVRVWGVYEP